MDVDEFYYLGGVGVQPGFALEDWDVLALFRVDYLFFGGVCCAFV